MALLKCNVCGGMLVIQPDGESAICESCGVKYTKELLQKKIIEIKGHVQVTNPIETYAGDTEKLRLIKNAETFFQLGDYEESFKVFNQITQQYPDDYRGWMGILQCKLSTLRDYQYDERGKIYSVHKVSLMEQDTLFQRVLGLCDDSKKRTELEKDYDELLTSAIKKFISKEATADVKDIIPFLAGKPYQSMLDKKLKPLVDMGISTAKKIVDQYIEDFTLLFSGPYDTVLQAKLSEIKYYYGYTVIYYDGDWHDVYGNLEENVSKTARGKVRCEYCGGKLNFFLNKCTYCGRKQNGYDKR